MRALVPLLVLAGCLPRSFEQTSAGPTSFDECFEQLGSEGLARVEGDTLEVTLTPVNFRHAFHGYQVISGAAEASAAVSDFEIELALAYDDAAVPVVFEAAVGCEGGQAFTDRYELVPEDYDSEWTAIAPSAW